MKATILPHRTEDAIKLYMTSPYFKDVEVLIPPGAETYQLISSVGIEKVCSARPTDFRPPLDLFLHLVGGAEHFHESKN